MARVRTDYLDCCEQPTLEVIRPLHQASHDAEALMRCTHCQTPWFYLVFRGYAAGSSWVSRASGNRSRMCGSR